ncbi:hypothetical protein GO986_20415 [Deinococcus sp. HMF7620]|uniref:Uncharacterized protein n=1 Tax=Deinococcus arboris TaxID=2682977 RepID=A0A7C9I1R9_9DEIO|nr:MULTISPECIES: hypothetical protein [Deinococcus]MBZ9752248.1 hypothetical protein [Deinococcus betulae]MVN89108.1 hypothetical protein [Deinococcus arboris]
MEPLSVGALFVGVAALGVLVWSVLKLGVLPAGQPWPQDVVLALHFSLPVLLVCVALCQTS